jgi:hypothetical protein
VNSNVSLRIKVKLSFELLETLGKLTQGDRSGACQEMQEFIDIVNAERVRNIPNTLANRWVAAAARIQSTIPCSQGQSSIFYDERPPALKFDSIFDFGGNSFGLPWSRDGDG